MRTRALTSAALCPDGAAGGEVGRTQGARFPGSLMTFGCGAHTASPLALCTLVLPRSERRPQRPRYGFHQLEVNVWGLTCGPP